jgi:hypothetical protein
MTEDFKEKLLKYLTGNITEETGTDTPQFEPTQTITNNLYQYIWDNYYGSTIPVLIDIMKSNQNDDYLCYGRGSNSDGTYFGFVIILDSNFQILEATKNYTSGTEMNEFIKLKQDEKGRFFGIDTDGTNYRFIILNNMLLKTQDSYNFVIQKTYNITNNYPSNFILCDILKNPNGSNYLIYGSSNNLPIAIEYTINVGMANEWKEYNYTSSTSYLITGGWASWGETLNFKLIGRRNLVSLETNVYIFELNNDSIILANTFNLPIDTTDYETGDYLNIESVILSENNAYVFVYAYATNKKVWVFRITNQITKLYESLSYTGLIGNIVTGGIRTDYYNAYVWYLLPTTNGYSFYSALINDDNYYQSFIQETDQIYAVSILNTYNQYNLYQFIFQSGNTVYRVPFVYNKFNYNGIEYENINSLVPNTSRIYDNNGNLVFARNLYNKSINNNTTVSTIEVPNTFLNDITIGTKELYGETNIILNYDINEITKNIYENLDINFFNTLTMVNANAQNEIINMIGASRLNNSISNTVDYASAKASKIRINYGDGDTLIQNIGIPTIINGIATYIFNIYVEKAIANIEIISNDEETSYQTIEGNFNIGSTYTITQDVRVE